MVRRAVLLVVLTLTLAAAGAAPATSQTTSLAITIEGTGPYPPGSALTVQVTGGTPGSYVVIQQCNEPATTCGPGVGAEVGSTGTAEVEVVVRRLIASTEEGVVDCANAPCKVRAGVVQTAESASVPIEIDGSVTVTRPVLTRVTPGRLPDRATIEIQGRGFEGSTPVELYECAWGKPVRCLDVPVGFAFTTATGTFTTDVSVTRTITGRDCAAGYLSPCHIWAFPYGNFDHVTTVPLVFDRSHPPIVPAVTVAPTTDLQHQQTVAVDGSGFAPRSFADLSQCAHETSPPTCRQLTSIDVAADGTLSTTVVVSRRVQRDDCAVVACTIRVRVYPTDTVDVSITFDGSVPPPPLPTVTVEPAAGLVDRQLVDVEIRDAEPGTYAFIQVCTSDGSACRGRAETSITASPTRVSIAVPRIVAGGADCAVVDCVIRTNLYGADTLTVDSPIAFDPDAPLEPGPGVHVLPATGLWDGQRIEIRGERFDPGAFMVIRQCVGSETTTPSCTPAPVYADADTQGRLSSRFPVRRTVDLAGSQHDCAVVTCDLVIDLLDIGEQMTFALAFDPDGPVTPSDLPAQLECVSWPTQGWPAGPLPAGVDPAAVAEVGDRMIDLYGGDSVVVIHGGRLVYENYADGVTADTILPSFSMSKSFTSTVVGLLVDDGLLALDERAPVEDWSDPADPRHAITLRHILNMSSGLQWYESYTDGASDVIQMVLSPDAAAYAIAKPLEHEPGTYWRYSTGDTMVLGHIIGETAGVTGASYEEFLHERLFDPLGINPVEPGFDAAGSWAAGWKTDTTTRNFAKLGLLYLRGGVWEDEQFLSREWVDFVRSPSPASSDYGGQFWLNGDGSFDMVGLYGQTVHIVPALDLIVAVNNGGGTYEMTALFETAARPSCGGVEVSAGADSATVATDATVTIAVLANDAGGTVGLAPTTLTVASTPAHGSAIVSGGAITYTPEPGYVGSDTFEYLVCTNDRKTCVEAGVAVDIVASRLP